jgi:predicted transcriptional regulator of viral defense system
MAEWHLTGEYRQLVDNRLAELAGEQWGVVSVRELRALGLDDSAILRRERSGRLIRLYRGTYAVGHVGEAPEMRWLAAAKAARGWLSHHSAAEHFEFLDLEDHWPDVTVTGNRRIPRIRVHRTRCLPPEDTTRHRNIPVTTPARTLVDLAGVQTETGLPHAVHSANPLELSPTSAGRADA